MEYRSLMFLEVRYAFLLSTFMLFTSATVVLLHVQMVHVVTDNCEYVCLISLIKSSTSHCNILSFSGWCQIAKGWPSYPSIIIIMIKSEEFYSSLFYFIR